MSYIFRLSFFALLLIIPGKLLPAKIVFLNFDKAAYYAVLEKNDLEEVNSMLMQLNTSAIPEKIAYEGALLMKKAGLVNKIKEKLSLFKSGRSKLEAAITYDDSNAEYHFLRLVIQENSPKIVKYKSDIKTDVEIVRNAFKKLSPEVQQVVKNYSRKSNFLKPADL